MSDSPINFGNIFSGNVAGLVSTMTSKQNSKKISKRVSKLENQVGSMISKQNQGPTQVEQPIEIQPEQQSNTVQNQISMEQGEQTLTPNNPTIASPFSPSTQQVAGNMFGAPMPGSFDRSMGENPIMLKKESSKVQQVLRTPKNYAKRISKPNYPEPANQVKVDYIPPRLVRKPTKQSHDNVAKWPAKVDPIKESIINLKRN